MKLYEFPSEISSDLESLISDSEIVKHKLSHKNLTIEIFRLEFSNSKDFENYAKQNQFNIVSMDESKDKSFPKPLQDFWI